MNKPAKTIELPTFEKIEELMADKYLKGKLMSLINDMNDERMRVSENGKKKLKPSPVESLVKLNLFNADFICTEYIEIYHKRSRQTHSIREFITYTINEVVDETFKHYERLYQKQQRKHGERKQNKLS